MNHELAKTLTTALVQFIDRERPEGTMCCSNTDCINLEVLLTSNSFDDIEAFIQKKLRPRLTEFEQVLSNYLKNDFEYFHTQKWDEQEWNDVIRTQSKELLSLAKKELLSYADESNPAIEAMADLERTYFCNPDKLPKWLTDDIARKELNAHTKGYNNGYKDAEKKIFSHGEGTYFYSKDGDVTYISPMPVSAPAIPIMLTTPSGWGCDGTHCTNPHGDCINCPRRFSSGGTITTPNTASGTSIATLHGNTSATDGKEHNPSFTD